MKKIVLPALCVLLVVVLAAGLISVKNRDKNTDIAPAQTTASAADKEAVNLSDTDKADSEKQEKESAHESPAVEAVQESPSATAAGAEDAEQSDDNKGKREKPKKNTEADAVTAAPVQAEPAAVPTAVPTAEPTQNKPVTATDDMGFLISANVKHDLVEKSKGKFTLDDITNVLLIGVDNDNLTGMDKRGNADGTMLVSINNKTKQLTLTSFMRDTKIRQPGEYEKKITTIYHDAGAKKLVEAIEQNFGVYINNYILVDYLDVMNIVDLLGGLDIELSAEEIYNTNGKLPSIEILAGVQPGTNYLEPNKPGMLHLNGIQTAGYLRIRPASTNYDSGRTERARKVITLMLQKVKEMSTSQKATFADKVLPMIETDMTDSEILSFSQSASEFMDFDLYSAKIPLDGTYRDSTDGNNFILPDFEINNKYLYESIYEGKH